jgi:predicted Zn-ribbon and HTH transcriptional regulator
MYCKDICNHFLSITRTRKVLRRLNYGRWWAGEPHDYKRCGYCNIYLRIKNYNRCPCCGHSRLTSNTHRYLRRTHEFKRIHGL